MEDEFLIFERQFSKEYSVDGLFIRLTCNKNIEAQYLSVLNITFTESLGLLIPSMIIDFVDGSGDLVNHNRLDTDAVFTLYFGRDPYDSTETKYRVASVNYRNQQPGKSTEMRFKVTFTHASWENTVAEKKQRAWSDSKASDIVSEIVSEKGYSVVDIEPSIRVFDYTIQTFTSDNDFIKRMKRTALAESMDGHYEFCLTFDNRFFFLSTKELMDRGVQRRRVNDMVTFRLGGDPPPQFRETQQKNNSDVPVSFIGIGGQEKYVPEIIDGAAGIKAGYYDWEEGEYITETRHFSDLNVSQLSEWSLIKESSEYVSKTIFGGRDSNVFDEVTSDLSSKALKLQDIHINVSGQIELHAGDIVELIVPTGEDSQLPYSEFYSGFYMIRGIEHRLSVMNTSDFISVITLTRHGVDSKELEGYSKSQIGRIKF